MGFGKRLRKRISRVRHTITAPVAKALAPIVGKSAASVIANPGGAVLSKLHPVTTAIGKVDAVVYGLGSGLVGAKYLASNRRVVGPTAANLGTAAIQIEKPLLGVAGGLIAGGLGSSIASGIGDAIAPNEAPPVGRDFNSFGADNSPSDFAANAAAGGKATSSATLLILVVIGGTVLVAFVFALKKRRR
jgi:hypothetical protein